MRAPALKILFAVAGITALVLAGPASAATHTYNVPASTFENAALRGSNGFTVELDLGPGFVNVVASKRLGSGTFEHVIYSAHAPKHFEAGRLKLRIGSYGKLQGRFVAKSTEHEPDYCAGGPVIVERGFYVGAFVFRGTDGFTKATSHRMRGSITRSPAETCREFQPPQTSHRSKSDAPVELRLRAATKSKDISFEATQESEPSEGADSTPLTNFTAFTASRYVHHGRLTIGSYLVSFFAKASTFLDPEPRTEVTVAPPAPFSGTGTYKAEGHGESSWTGNLSVDLPAFGRVHLTGKKLIATVEEKAVNDSGTFYAGGEATTNP